MREIVIVGESYFDREFLKFLIQKYKGNNFYFNLESKHDNKSSVLKDFQKFKNWAINAKKADLDINIVFSCDLDFEGNCISSFFEEQSIESQEFSENFLMTVQVREIESWILADPIGLEKWTKIPQVNFDRCLKNFEIKEKPTTTFLHIVSQHSEKFKNLLCHPQYSEKKSENYSEELLDFIEKYFDPERARKNNKSLDRFLKKIENNS